MNRLDQFILTVTRYVLHRQTFRLGEGDQKEVWVSSRQPHSAKQSSPATQQEETLSN